MKQQAITIMLVDDDADDRTFFRLALKELNPEIKYIPMSGAVEALKYLNASKTVAPDFIFLDMNMPQVNGFECLEELKKSETLRHIPVAIYSTSRMEEQVTKAEQLGAVAFVLKPMKYQDIPKEIENAISIVT